MTDNNWTTPEWVDKKVNVEHYSVFRRCERVPFRVCVEIAEELNEKIKNILESAEKRDCKTCNRHNEFMRSILCRECLDSFYGGLDGFCFWTPKEGE